MTSVLYLIDDEHFDYIASRSIQRAEMLPLLYWASPTDTNCELYDFLNQHVTRLETDQPVNTEKLVVPAGKFVMGVGCAWNENDKMVSMDCDLFSNLHVELETPFKSVVNLMHRIRDHIVRRELRPNNTTALGWVLTTSSEGYRVLRLCGLHE